MINSVIDFEGDMNKKITVCFGVSERLDYLKSHYEGLGDFLTVVAENDMKNEALPECIKTMSIEYYPQLGYLLKVPYDDRTTPSLKIRGLEFKFKSKEHVFYKNDRTR